MCGVFEFRHERLPTTSKIRLHEAVRTSLTWSSYPRPQATSTKPGDIPMPNEITISKERMKPKMDGGHLYMQTNERENVIVRYKRSTTGMITEVERIPTGGAGSGVFKPISGQESAPNAFEGAGSIILTPDRRFLFTT